MEKLLSVILTAFILLIIVLCSLCLHVETINTNGNDKTVTPINAGGDDVLGTLETCQSTACLAASSELLKTIDESIDPCDDFTKFTCNGFYNKSFFPNENVILSKYSLTDDFIYLSLDNLFRKAIDPNEPHYSKLMKKYYKACRDVNTIERSSLSDVRHILDQLGGWPVILDEKWDEDHFEWTKTVYKAKNMGLPHELFLSIKVDKSPQTELGQNRPKVIYVKPSTLHDDSIRSPAFKLETYRDHYIDLILGVASSFDPSLSTLRNSTFRQEIMETVDFESELNNIVTNSKSDITGVSISELSQYSSIFPWFDYISNILAPDVIITSDEKVYLEKSDYVSQLEKLLAKTPKRIQANALIWNIVFSSLKFLQENTLIHFVNFEKAIGRRTEFSPRWLECTFDVLLQFKPGTTALFAKHVLKKSTRDNALEMANLIMIGISKRYSNIDHSTTFITQEQTVKFLSNLNRTDIHIAYPNELTNDKNVEDYYKSLEYNTNKYFNLYMNLTALIRRREFMALKDPKFDWIEQVPVLFSTWSWTQDTRNKIIITTGMLQGEYSSEELPKYMTFATLGFLISGGYAYLYMKDFDDAPKCISDPQYKNKTDVTEKLLNDYSQQFGVDEAYLTYKDWVKSHKNVEILPNFANYTINQMFWITHGNSLCIKYRRSQFFNYLSTGYSKRTNIGLRNSKYFAKDFACPIGSKMNPKDKCTVF